MPVVVTTVVIALVIHGSGTDINRCRPYIHRRRRRIVDWRRLHVDRLRSHIRPRDTNVDTDRHMRSHGRRCQ